MTEHHNLKNWAVWGKMESARQTRLTISLQPVPAVSEGPGDTLQLKHEGEDLAITRLTGFRQYHIDRPLHL